MIYQSVSVYIIHCLSTNKKSIFKSVGTLHNFIYKKRQSKKDSILKDILKTNNYIYELIKIYENIDRELLKSKMSELTEYKMKENINTSYIQEQLSYKQRQYEGEQTETRMRGMIENVFVDKIIHSKYKYTHYDYVGSVVFYEIKNLSVMYPFVFLGTDKAICENLIIVYTFETLNNRQFYIKYDTELFNTFDKTYTKPKNRMYYNEVYLIPKYLLIEFNDTEKIQIKTIDETELRNELIQKDIRDYNTKTT